MRGIAVCGQSEGVRSARSGFTCTLLVSVSLLLAPAPLVHAQTASSQRWVATWGTAQQSFRAPARQVAAAPRQPPRRQ